MRRRYSAEEAELAKTAGEVQKWFRDEVTYEDEPYLVDGEQAAAIAEDARNTIVVARAGSGKTRTIVAKIVYLIAQRGVRPEEIIAFVFNANAAAEINARLAKMMVRGVPAVTDAEAAMMSKTAARRMSKTSARGTSGTTMSGARIAVTFHAFAREIVYSMLQAREKCGQILAGAKEDFVVAIVQGMYGDTRWREEILKFERDIAALAAMMTQFINRAQQRFLGEGDSLASYIERRLQGDVDEREARFLRIGEECYKRYHWYLLNAGPRSKLADGEFQKYGTDFNLIVSWAAKMIESGVGNDQICGKKHILIDEYQDFSQLFLSITRAIRQAAPGAKLFVVGDDWQAINRFAGSDVKYFKEFEKFFDGETKRHAITTNYRCDTEIVETARRFMRRAMGESGEFRAKSRRAGKVAVVDPRRTPMTCAMTDYDLRANRKDIIYQREVWRVLRSAPKLRTVQYIKTLVRLIRENRKATEILLLHRNNETGLEGMTLDELGVVLRRLTVLEGTMSEEEYLAKVRLMTMHKSKGLEAEVVVILEADEGVIPKVHPDTRLYAVFGETGVVALDDQKRLFYVAMTRAKKRLYIIYTGDKGKNEGFIKYLGKGLEWELTE